MTPGQIAHWQKSVVKESVSNLWWQTTLAGENDRAMVRAVEAELRNTATWQARAEALLDVFRAAWDIVDRKAIVIDRGGVVIGRDQYERLREAVEAYGAKAEGKG